MPRISSRRVIIGVPAGLALLLAFWPSAGSLQAQAPTPVRRVNVPYRAVGGDFHRDAEGTAGRAAEAALPAVVKPARQGSSIGMTMVKDAAGMRAALEVAFEFDSIALVEERIEGTELTVGIIGNRDLQALPVVEIVSKREFFDFRAKYDPGLCEEIVPARIPDEVARAAQDIAVRAHRALGCRNLSRVDLMQASRGPVVLEVNTMPGMTVNSLLPKAAKAAGIPFAELDEPEE